MVSADSSNSSASCDPVVSSLKPPSFFFFKDNTMLSISQGSLMEQSELDSLYEKKGPVELKLP